MTTCITKEQETRIRAALRVGDVDIDKLAEMDTATRKEVFSKYLDDDLVTKFNKGFEERIITSSRNFAEKTKGLSQEEIVKLEAKIAERQKKLLTNYVEREISKNNIPKSSRNNVIDRVQKVQHMLTPSESSVLLEDLISQRLGVGVTQETAEYLGKLSEKAIKARDDLRKTRDVVGDEAREAFEKFPETKSRRKEIEQITDATERKVESDRLLAEAEQHADDVFNGLKKADGSKLTKAEYKEVMKPRLQMARDIEELTNYMSELHRGIEKTTVKEAWEATGYAKAQAAGRLLNQGIYGSFGLGKSLLASMDFSYIFRQGWQTALTHPGMLTKNVDLAARDAWRTLTSARRAYNKDKNLIDKWFSPFENNTYDFARMEVNTRANALNGKYDIADNGYGLNVFKEEAFPSSVAERVPFLGRLYKASEVGYNAMALRMRADLADAFIRKMEKQGIDMTAKKNANELGLLVGSMTGRGLPFGAKFLEGGGEKLTERLNQTFFSPRFVGSQFYTLYSPIAFIADPKNPIVKLRAQKATQAFVEIAAIMYTLNVASEMIHGEPAIDFNPGSSNFGHIKSGNYSFDMTGAHGSAIALMGKIWNQRHGGLTYDARLGIYKDSPWSQDVMDLVFDFFANKTSPTASVIKEFVNGHNFGSDEFSWTQAARNMMIPLTIQVSAEAILDDPASADGYLVMLGEIVGVSSKDMRITPGSADWKKLEEADKGLHKKAVEELNEQLFADIKELRDSKDFQKMSREEQDKVIEKKAAEQKSDTVDKYMKKVR